MRAPICVQRVSGRGFCLNDIIRSVRQEGITGCNQAIVISLQDCNSLTHTVAHTIHNNAVGRSIGDCKLGTGKGCTALRLIEQSLSIQFLNVNAAANDMVNSFVYNRINLAVESDLNIPAGPFAVQHVTGTIRNGLLAHIVCAIRKLKRACLGKTVLVCRKGFHNITWHVFHATDEHAIGGCVHDLEFDAFEGAIALWEDIIGIRVIFLNRDTAPDRSLTQSERIAGQFNILAFIADLECTSPAIVFEVAHRRSLLDHTIGAIWDLPGRHNRDTILTCTNSEDYIIQAVTGAVNNNIARGHVDNIDFRALQSSIALCLADHELAIHLSDGQLACLGRCVACVGADFIQLPCLVKRYRSGPIRVQTIAAACRDEFLSDHVGAERKSLAICFRITACISGNSHDFFARCIRDTVNDDGTIISVCDREP